MSLLRNLNIGTVVWKWCGNNGKVHQFKIHKSYYVPDSNIHILSPQYCSKKDGSIIISLEGTADTTNDSITVLFWNGGKKKLDIFLWNIYNFANLYLEPVYQ